MNDYELTEEEFQAQFRQTQQFQKHFREANYANLIEFATDNALRNKDATPEELAEAAQRAALAETELNNVIKRGRR